ncbi:MAG: SUMF1/EgtB/PvdO family nonheme iron enzyme [Planctomycetota bacterium]|jgi:formylglycine-generating enzyme required for sulfatase activity|nr:SUMF1/EgtB/PvdO family nonheme iron enzyme [Planctomycetota bacterium]
MSGVSDKRLEQLKALGDLKEQGILTEDEFAAEKRKILSASPLPAETGTANSDGPEPDKVYAAAKRRNKRLAMIALIMTPFLLVALCLYSADTPGGIIRYLLARLAKEDLEVKLNDNVSMKFVKIPAGTFLMGSPASERGRDDSEVQHEVTLTKAFYMGIYEVTQAQWRAVMGENPSEFKGDRRPVESVSWEDATAFCRKVSELTGRKLRLPTEAEWEYACRAGTRTAFNTGDTINTDQANYNGNDPYGNGGKGVFRKQTVEVGSFPANAWGLYDMHGNVWEWCSDWVGKYDLANRIDPHGVANGSGRVLRGGCCFNNAGFCRSALRYGGDPGYRVSFNGFRVVLD